MLILLKWLGGGGLGGGEGGGEGLNHESGFSVCEISLESLVFSQSTYICENLSCICWNYLVYNKTKVKMAVSGHFLRALKKTAAAPPS